MEMKAYTGFLFTSINWPASLFAEEEEEIYVEIKAKKLVRAKAWEWSSLKWK